MGNMGTWVTITWENDRLLFLSASTTGRTVTFEHAATLDDPRKIGDLISQYRLAKADTIVVLNRSDVEVRPMVFPPVPAEELPDLVKFQASREFNNYDPNAPVDFFVTSKLEDVSRSTLFPAIKSTDSVAASDGAPKHILASTLRLNTFQKIKAFCDEHNLVLRHIILRPCAAASLWRFSGSASPNRSTLLVELDKFEASQTVVFQGEPVFMRSPKITRPHDVSVPDFVARILAELKRTRIAVRNEIQGIDVDEVVLCGSGMTFDSLAEQLTKGLEKPVRLFDPMKGLTIKAKDADEQYAALFGAIQQIVRREPFQIDFCNPKKRAEDISKRNIFTGVTAAVMFLVLGLFGYILHSRITLDNENKFLAAQFANMEKASGPIVENKKQLDEIDKWLADDIDWFEQLAWLSQNALPSQDMMIRELNFASSPTTGRTVGFLALLRNQSQVSPMVESFRDTNHIPQAGGIGPESGNPRYLYNSRMVIRLSRDAALAAPPALVEPTEPTPRMQPPTPIQPTETPSEP